MFEAAQPIGVATNNVAEYRALILGLKVAKLLGATNLMVYGDSKLVCNQMKGEWAVRNAGLRSLHREARFIASSFDSFDIQYISREKNSMADSLANKAMDGQSAGLDILAKWEGMSRMQKPLRGNAHSTSKQVQSSLEQSIDRRNDGSRPRGSNCKRARPVLGAGSSRIMGGDVPAHNLGMKAKKYSRSILRGGINLFSRRAPC